MNNQIFKHYINPFGFTEYLHCTKFWGCIGGKSNASAHSDLESTRNSQLGMEMWGRVRYFLFLKCQSLGSALALIMQGSGMLSPANSGTVIHSEKLSFQKCNSTCNKKYWIDTIFHINMLILNEP